MSASADSAASSATLDLETALYDEDAVARDGARARLAAKCPPEVLSALVAALDAPTRVTRRRASRLLSASRPERVRPLLLALLLPNASAPSGGRQPGGVSNDRHRASAARLLTLLSPQGEPALADVLCDPSPRVRKAAATPAAPIEALLRAVDDADAEVVAEVLSALTERAATVPAETLQRALARHGAAIPAAQRLLAAASDDPTALLAGAAAGDEAALDHLASAAIPLARVGALPTGPARRAGLWSALRAGDLDPDWLVDPDPRVRAAVARCWPADLPMPGALLSDPDPGVAWLARRSASGAFADAAIAARLGPHARLDAPSAKPPYGLSADDVPAEVVRVDAALALCHTRFDVNLGVAVRSAEAAGLSEVFTVGRGELLRSPARGTDQVIPVTHLADPAALLRRARERGWQIVVVQQTPASVPYHRALYPPRPLFVMGAEDEGVPAALRAAADLAVEIPLFGAIDSLNVAATATAVIFHWRCSLDA